MKPALSSERVVLAAPMSFHGSAARIWKITPNANPWWHSALIALAILGVVMAWTVIAAWYVLFGLLLVPYRLVRRGQRRRKMQDMRHREQLAAIASLHQPQP